MKHSAASVCATLLLLLGHKPTALPEFLAKADADARHPPLARSALITDARLLASDKEDEEDEDEDNPDDDEDQA